MSDPKLDTVRACVNYIMRQNVDEYTAKMTDATLRKILDNARKNSPATIRLSPVTLQGTDVTKYVDALLSDRAIPASKNLRCEKSFMCDVYLAGSPGSWRSEFAEKLDDFVVCDPIENLRRSEKGDEQDNEAAYEVPQGIHTEAVLYYVENGCDDINVIGGLISTVWYHGSAVVACVEPCPQRDILLSVCRLGGAHVCGSLDEAIDSLQQIIDLKEERVFFEPYNSDNSTEENDEILDDNETVIGLPSGNELVIKYFGNDAQADRVMMYSRSDGSGKSPMNLYLVMPDPDMESEPQKTNDGQILHPVDIHSIKVRHHGPTDSGQSSLPEDFLPS